MTEMTPWIIALAVVAAAICCEREASQRWAESRILSKVAIAFVAAYLLLSGYGQGWLLNVDGERVCQHGWAIITANVLLAIASGLATLLTFAWLGQRRTRPKNSRKRKRPDNYWAERFRL